MKSKFTIILVLIFSAISFSQNFNDALRLSEPDVFISARALGMGNSYIALSNDFSAVIFNPAGLGLVKKVELSAGLNFDNYDNTSSFFGNNINTNKSTINLNQVGFVYPVPTRRGSMVFSLGYNRVKDFNSATDFNGYNAGSTSMIQFLTGDVNETIPITNDLGLAYEIDDPNTGEYIRDTTLINGQLNQSGNYRTKGSIGKWSFAGSVEIAKNLLVGGTFNIVSGSYKRDRDYYEDDTRDIYTSGLELVPGDPTTKDFQTFYLNDIIEWDLSGWDFKLGMLYNAGNIFTFGATVKFPTYYTIKENYYVNGESFFGTGAVYQLNQPLIDNVQYEIKTPFEYGAGAALNLLILTVSGEVNIIDYTQMKFTKGLGQEYRIQRNKEIENIFRTAITYKAAAEMKIPFLPIWARAGAMYFQSPYENDPVEFDKKYLTAGVGLKLGGNFSVDVAYAYGWWKNIKDNYDSNVSRISEDITVQKIVLTMSAALN